MRIEGFKIDVAVSVVAEEIKDTEEYGKGINIGAHVNVELKEAEISDKLTNNTEDRPPKCDILAKSITSWLRNFRAGNLIWVSPAFLPCFQRRFRHCTLRIERRG